jgi:hypothetical protein
MVSRSFLLTPSVQDNECAFLQKTARCTGADTGTGPRNDDYLAFESLHGFLQ